MKKQLFTLGMAGTMIASMGTAVFAAPVEQSVDVSYDNTKEIIDPDDPTWAVQIPSAITFVTGDEIVDATVKLVAKEGDLPDAIQAKVSVKSKNGYTMDHATDTMSKVKYALKYDGLNAFTKKDTPEEITTLTKTAHTKAGDAKMTGTAKAVGAHKDLLTYSVERTDV